jgi:iron complex transport system ATP-binding protein
MIELEHVTVRLAGRAVVEDVSLRVAAGSWLTLIGPNGAGKTSLLAAISGLLGAGGRIVIGGAERADLGNRQLARLLAIVPQDPLIPPDMTVAEFALLGRTPYLGYFGRLGRADRRAAEQALGRLGLTALGSRRLGTLSGGERQRAVLARALAQQAPILLLDEPTAALDIGRQQEVLELLASLHAERELTVLAAMHDLTLACQYADRLALIDAGRLVACGAPAEVLSEATIGRHYRATVRMTELGEAGPVVVPVRRRRGALVGASDEQRAGR